MERLQRVQAQNIFPQVGTDPSVHVSTHGEAIARMKHETHRLGARRDNEIPGGLDLAAVGVANAGNCVRPSHLVVLQRQGEREAPEGSLRVFIEAQPVNCDPLSVCDSLGDGRIGSDRAGLAQVQLRLGLAGLCDNQDASMPDRRGGSNVHVLEINERAAGDVNLGIGIRDIGIGGNTWSRNNQSFVRQSQASSTTREDIPE